jgi:pimeloyl-ACP methyl ester carboxylesterase
MKMQEQPQPRVVRRHGPPGRPVVVLHGGPGAPGSAGLLARALADPLHVLEPWQRRSGDAPVTVARHIEDLAELLARDLAGEKPALAGASWGAMLALAFTSAYPDRVSAVALIGCGTFDRRARLRLHATLAQRTPPELQRQLVQLGQLVPDETERAIRRHLLRDPLYTYRRAIDDTVLELDLRGHHETWKDMLRLQESGVYPAAFRSITCPVLMLHGSYDPHPGGMIRDGLQPFIPQLEYTELDRCGHVPWVEEHARERFLSLLRAWLERRLAEARAASALGSR